MRGIHITFAFLILCYSISAQSIWTVNDGSWTNASTWNLNRIPVASDFVKITHDLTLYQSGVVVDSMEISNYAGGSGGLIFDCNGNLVVTKHLNVFAGNYDADAYLLLRSGAEMEVGSLFMQRLTVNATNNSAGLGIYGNSNFTCNGDFIYEYDGVNSLDNKSEITLTGNGEMLVKGNTTISSNTGNNFSLSLLNRSMFTCEGMFNYHFNHSNSATFELGNNASFVIHGETNFINNSLKNTNLNLTFNGFSDFKGDLLLTSNLPNTLINLNMSSAKSKMWIGNKLGLYAESGQDIFINMTDSSYLNIKGNVERQKGLGNLTMGDHCMWEYAGDGSQDITCGPGEDGDAFQFSNIKFAASENGVMVLEGDLNITKSLDMSMGIIETHDTAMLIVADGAEIIGASADSYVQGPMKKINLSGTDPFIFPFGHNGKYAPMGIVSPGGRAASGEFTARFMNCPPPWGGELAVNLDQISDEDHWTLERTEGTEVNVILHWSDAEAQGINDLSTMVVAMYNPDTTAYPMFPAGWTSIGNGETTGGTGTGTSGSIMNIGTCPPPWGIQHFSLGSTSSSNVLPLEMESFSAKLMGEVIDINWRTNNEVNIDFLVVEKSLNGSDFFPMEELGAQNGLNTGGAYHVTDQDPTVGLNYYRIAQVDLGGMTSFSAIRSVEYSKPSDLLAYPNPINHEISITGSILEDAREIKIIDGFGKYIYSNEIHNSDELINMSTDELNMTNSGVYFMEIYNGALRETVKVVKK